MTLIGFKYDVLLHPVSLAQPEFGRALLMVALLAPPTRDDMVVITSLYDGTHSEKSRHYAGQAFDVRLRDKYKRKGSVIDDETVTQWALRLRQALPEWDVLDEGDHLHLERDPK